MDQSRLHTTFGLSSVCILKYTDTLIHAHTGVDIQTHKHTSTHTHPHVHAIVLGQSGNLCHGHLLVPRAVCRWEVHDIHVILAG